MKQTTDPKIKTLSTKYKLNCFFFENHRVVRELIMNAKYMHVAIERKSFLLIKCLTHVKSGVKNSVTIKSNCT